MSELKELQEEKEHLEYLLKDVELYPNLRIAAEAKLEYVKSKIKEL